MDDINHLIEEGKTKANELNVTLKTIEHITNRLQHQYTKAQEDVTNTFHYYVGELDTIKNETLKELDEIYNLRLKSLNHLTSKTVDRVEKVKQLAIFVERFKKFSSSTDASELLLFKNLIETPLTSIRDFDPDISIPRAELEFVSNHQAVQVSFTNPLSFSLSLSLYFSLSLLFPLSFSISVCLSVSLSLSFQLSHSHLYPYTLITLLIDLTVIIFMMIIHCFLIELYSNVFFQHMLCIES